MFSSRVDYIVTGARVHTLSGSALWHGGVAISAGRIAAIGTAAELRHLRGDSTVCLDFPEGTIVPGFTDAHCHPIASISVPRGVDLSGLKTMGQVAEALASARDEFGGSWVFGSGLDPVVFGGDVVSNRLIGSAIGLDRYGHVTMFDGHSAIVTQNVLDLAGISEEIEYPDGARIVADASGRLTGHVLEFTALKRVRRVVPVLSTVEKAQQLYELLSSMASAGITTAHVMDMQDPDTIEVLKAAERIGALPVFLRLSPWCMPGTTDEEVEQLIKLQGTSGVRWRVEGIKLFADGTVEGGTAWLESPDARGECNNPLWRVAGTFEQRLAQFHEAGISTATHAIGDRSVRFVVETIADLPESDVRHRIEHLETVDSEVVGRLVQARISASMQPTHCTQHTRSDGTDEWSQRVGEARARRAWCTRDIIEAGGILALGSDYPVAPFNPLSIMADAQLRRPAADPQVEPIVPTQSITALQALSAYTLGAAASIGGEVNNMGLSVGSPASITVLDVDPLTVDPETLSRGQALLTMSDGLVTHQKTHAEPRS